jgi:hypothetical protein
MLWKFAAAKKVEMKKVSWNSYPTFRKSGNPD